MFENMKISGSCWREIYTLTRCYPLSDSASCFRNSAEIQALKGTASRIWYTITGQFNRICVILMRFTIIKNLYFCMISMQVKTKYLLMPIHYTVALCQILSESPQNNGACHGWSWCSNGILVNIRFRLCLIWNQTATIETCFNRFGIRSSDAKEIMKRRQNRPGNSKVTQPL